MSNRFDTMTWLIQCAAEMENFLSNPEEEITSCDRHHIDSDVKNIKRAIVELKYGSKSTIGKPITKQSKINKEKIQYT